MSLENRSPSILRFGTFEVDLRSGELRKAGFRVKLQEQPFKILMVLLEHPGEVVTREQLRRLIWPQDTFGDFDHAVNVAVAKLRTALNDSAEAPRLVETLPRRGYRFIAPINRKTETQRVAPSRPEWLGQWTALIAGIIVLVAAVLLVMIPRFRNRVFGNRSTSSPAKIMLAVLPFENLSNDPQQDYFADGMTAEMISQLGRVEPERLGVIARGSVMHYKHGDQSADRVAQELGVQYILAGSIRRDGQQVRITAELVRPIDRTQLWARNYDAEINNVLALQSRVAHDVASIIQLKLSPGTNLDRAHYSVDPEALQLYFRGRYDLNRIWHTGGNRRVGTAISLFQQALEKDATYAPAYAGLAEAYMWAVYMGLDNSHALETELNARTAAEKAVQLDNSLADAHIAMALYQESQWNFSATNEEAKRATELDPNYAVAHELYGLLLVHLGRLEEASTQMQLAATLDPHSLHLLNFMGHYYYAAQQWDKVIETAEAEIKSDPDFLLSYPSLVGAYEEKGMIVEALRAYSVGSQRAGDNMKEVNKIVGVWRKAYDTGGVRGYWKKNLQLTLEDVKRGGARNPVEIAGICVHAGEVDQAFAWLEKGYQQHDITMVWLKRLYPLHSDPRYQDLLRRIGLPQ